MAVKVEYHNCPCCNVEMRCVIQDGPASIFIGAVANHVLMGMCPMCAATWGYDTNKIRRLTRAEAEAVEKHDDFKIIEETRERFIRENGLWG